MRYEKILSVPGYLDPELIEEAENYQAGKKAVYWVRWGALAACFCLCALGAAKVFSPRAGAGVQSIAATAEKNTGYYDEAAADVAAEEAFSFEEAEEEAFSLDMEEAAEAVEAPAAEEKSAKADGLYPEPLLDAFDRSLNSGDMAVSNGSFVLSESLSAAIGEYGGSTRYRVVVELFRDGKVIDSGSTEAAAEEERLAEAGFTVVHECRGTESGSSEYITLWAEKDRLLDFPASGSYGYYLEFYADYSDLDGLKEDVSAEFLDPTVK